MHKKQEKIIISQITSEEGPINCFSLISQFWNFLNCKIHNLRLFHKRIEMGPSFDVICEIIFIFCFLCILRNLQNSQFAIISQMVWVIRKISKLAYQGKKINRTFFWCNLQNYFFLLFMHIAKFAKFTICDYFANGLRYLKNFNTGWSRGKN